MTIQRLDSLLLRKKSRKLLAWVLASWEVRIYVVFVFVLNTKFNAGPTSAITAFMSDVKVTVVDIDPERIAAWKSMSLPIYEPGLEELVYAARDGVETHVDITNRLCPGDTEGKKRKTRQPSLFFSIDIDGAIAEADLIFLCVNTPTKWMGVGKGAGADLRFVEAATRTIARVATQSKIVVEKSTVPCRTAQSIREIVRRYSWYALGIIS